MKLLSFINSHKIVTGAILVGAIGSAAGLTVIAQNKDVPVVNQVVETSEQPKVEEKPVEDKKTIENIEEAPATAPENNDDTKPDEPVKEESSNPYAEGTAMNYSYDQRQKSGKIVGVWGNAWVASAAKAGITVDGEPEVGSTLIYMSTIGHITSVNDGIIGYKTMIEGNIYSGTIPANTSGVKIIH